MHRRLSHDRRRGSVMAIRTNGVQTVTRLTVEPGIQPERSRLREVWHVLRRKPLGMAGGSLMLLMVLMAIGADLVAPYDPLVINPSHVLKPPSRAHWMGTDDQRRDVMSRVIHGTRISHWVGFLAV